MKPWSMESRTCQHQPLTVASNNQEKTGPVSPSRQTRLTGPSTRLWRSRPPRTARFARAAEHGRIHCNEIWQKKRRDKFDHDS
jgi:hypothetical protein